MNFLLKIIKQRAGEKLSKRNVKAVAEFFDRPDRNTMSGGIEHTVNGRWRNTGTDSKFIWTNPPLVTKFFETIATASFTDSSITSFTIMLRLLCMIVTDIEIFRVRTCVY